MFWRRYGHVVEMTKKHCYDITRINQTTMTPYGPSSPYSYTLEKKNCGHEYQNCKIRKIHLMTNSKHIISEECRQQVMPLQQVCSLRKGCIERSQMCNTGGDTTFQITHMSFPNTKYIILNTKHMIRIPNISSQIPYPPSKKQNTASQISILLKQGVYRAFTDLCATREETNLPAYQIPDHTHVKYKIHYPKYKIQHCK